jgi:hypothetical protein
MAEIILDSLCHICNDHMGGLNRLKRRMKNINRRWPKMAENHNFMLFWNKNILKIACFGQFFPKFWVIMLN